MKKTIIIPAINAQNFEEIREKIRLLESVSKLGGDTSKLSWVHLDVADGTWTKNTLWHNPEDLINFKTALNIEVHLMILKPEKRINEWLLKSINPVRSQTPKASANAQVHSVRDKISNGASRTSNGIKRIVFNVESSDIPDFIIDKSHQNNVEVGISIGPGTSWTKAIPFAQKVDLIQVLRVYPGLAGQELIEDSLDKIQHLRKKCSRCNIEVDGGINPETAKKAKEAGANIFVSASYIFSGDDSEIKNRIENLKKAVS